MLIMWSVNYIAAKVALLHFEPLTLVAFRFEVAGTVMVAIYFAQKRRVPIERRHLWTLACLAFLGVVVNQGLFTIGLNYTSSAHSAIIVALDPILILALARAMGIESLTPGKVVGVGLAFLGIVILETEHGSPTHSPLLMGDLISLGGAVGFSVYAVFAKPITQEYDAVALNTFNCVAAAIAFLPVAVRRGVSLNWRGVAWQGWVGMFYMAICSSVAAYLIFYWALRHMEPSRVAVINYLQPILVILLAAHFLAEPMSRHLLAGTALVLMGVYLAERRDSWP
jgi:drug/metabolite transporter (DMT)-like permease